MGEFEIIEHGVVKLNDITVKYENDRVALLLLDFNVKNVDLGYWRNTDEDNESGDIMLDIFPPGGHEQEDSLTSILLKNTDGWQPFACNSNRYTGSVTLFKER